MNNNDLYITIQKRVLEYCEKISREEFILLTTFFVFQPSGDNLDKSYIKDFVTEMECLDIYQKHMDDLNNEPYFLKCHGSSLKFIEDLKNSLLVASYNLLKNDYINRDLK